MKKVETGLLTIDDMSIDEVISRLEEFSNSSSFDIVVTPNIDHLSRLVKDKKGALPKIYRDSSLCLCDSQILQKLLFFKNIRIKHVIPGSTLTEYLFRKGYLDNKRVCVIGADDEDVEQLIKDFPAISISHINPSMGFINKPSEVENIVQQVCDLNPDFVFLAVGSPRQEVLADKIKQKFHRGVGLCIGASILFLVGKEKRAPQLFQTLHLEWLYRAFQRPKTLFKRYVKNFLALPAIYSEL